MKYKAKITAYLELASHESEGTVTVDRDHNLFSVRPLHGRRVYELPLNKVAEMVVRDIIMSEVKK
jgi:hypothetical protein